MQPPVEESVPVETQEPVAVDETSVAPDSKSSLSSIDSRGPPPPPPDHAPPDLETAAAGEGSAPETAPPTPGPGAAEVMTPGPGALQDEDPVEDDHDFGDISSDSEPDGQRPMCLRVLTPRLAQTQTQTPRCQSRQ